MNYQQIYNDLISRGLNRVLEPGVLYDRHHIVPKSLGGSNAPTNMVNLTLREHFVAHRLLVKIHRTNQPYYKKMLYALWRMCNRGCANGVNSHVYDQTRTAYINDHPQRDPHLKQTIKSKRDAGLYKHSGAQVSQSLKQTLNSLSEEEMTERMRNSTGKADHVKRGKSIRQGKGSKFRLINLDGSCVEFWSYEDVQTITNVKYATILERLRNHDGILRDGRKVETIIKYKNGNHKKVKSKLLLEKTDGSSVIFDQLDDVHHLTGYSYNHIKSVLRNKGGLLSNGSRVSYLQRYMGRK